MDMQEHIRSYLDSERFLQRTEDEVMAYIEKHEGEEGLAELRRIFDTADFSGASQERKFFRTVSKHAGGIAFYDLLKSRNRASIEQMYKKIVGEGIEGASVLDIGCGTGLELCFLAEEAGSNGRAIGIDISPEILNEAIRRIKRRGIRNAYAYLGDRDKLDFDDCSFDLAVCMNSLFTAGEFGCIDGDYQYGYTTRRRIAEIKRVLKQGGKAKIIMGVADFAREYESSRLKSIIQGLGLEILENGTVAGANNMPEVFISAKK